MNRLLIWGAGGHAEVVADIALLNGYRDIAFSDNSGREDCLGFECLGDMDPCIKYNETDTFVAIGNPRVRQKIVNDLRTAGNNIVTLIHPNSVISGSAIIGIGTVVMADAVINPKSKIGDGCIINTCASVDHDNCINDYAHISVGAHLAGTVNVGERTWIGIGATVSNNISICNDCMIGAGAVVVSDIDIPQTYVGVPAKPINTM